MGALAEFGIKQKDGSYKNYTISISDETNQYGQNVSVYESQTEEQREAKEKKKYIGNGKVFWTDGKIIAGGKKAVQKKEVKAEPTITDDTDLPF